MQATYLNNVGSDTIEYRTASCGPPITSLLGADPDLGGGSEHPIGGEASKTWRYGPTGDSRVWDDPARSLVPNVVTQLPRGPAEPSPERRAISRPPTRPSNATSEPATPAPQPLSGQDVHVRRTLAGAYLLLAISLLVPACGSGSQSLVDYAEGDWTCRFSSEEPEDDIPDITATVSATGDAEGRVEITFPWFEDPLTGEWRLDLGELVVRWDDGSGQAEAAPISLDVDQFRIRSGLAEDKPEWVTVDVDRRDRVVTFDFTFPGTEDSPGGEDRGRFACEKS